MSNPDWALVKAIFTEADRLPADERAAYLDRACGPDLALRARVEKLLREVDVTETVPLLNPDRPSSAIATGDTLAGRFRILRFVGRGGMGEVYEAEDSVLRANVAIKTLRPELAGDPEFLARFRREVQVARQVTHPNVCRVFDFGQDDSRVFFTMEFLNGETLTQTMRSRSPMPLEDAYLLASQIASGLDALHQQGIVHRDLKPGNVLIVSGTSIPRRAVIGDFGLARALEPATGGSLTQSEQVMGTPDYMAPEQLLGKPATPAADVYALGLILYEMVSGRKPYPGGAAVEVALKRVTEPPPPIEGLNPVWMRTILQCLSKEPQDRPASAIQVAEMLRGDRPTAKLRRPPSRPWVWPAAAAISLALALSAGWPRLEGWLRGTTNQKPSIALLPLRVIGNNPELRVFADGLMETMTSRITQYENRGAPVMVVPASEVRAQGVQTAAAALAKFHVTSVVEGTIDAQGDRIRLTQAVVDTSTMRQIASTSVDDQRANAWQIQDLAVARLATALELRVQSQYATQQLLSPPSPGAYEFYLQARGYLQRNDQPSSVASAVELLRKAIALDSSFALAHSDLGRAYFYQFQQSREPGLMAIALESSRRGVDLSPAAPAANIAIGNVLYGLGRAAESRPYFEKAIAADSRANEAYQGLAKAYLGTKDFANAEATYLKAISLRPEDWTGYKALGLYYFERGQHLNAAAQFQRVVDLTPDNAQGFVNLGAAYSVAERWDLAEKAWLRAIQLDPADAASYTNLGKMYLDERRDTAAAIAMYEKAVAANPRDYRSWGQLGRAHTRLGATAKARSEFTRAIEQIDSEMLINPKFIPLHTNSALYRALLGHAGFQAAIDRALALSPDRAETLLRAAEVYAISGNPAKAREYLDKAVQRGAQAKAIARSEYLATVTRNQE